MEINYHLQDIELVAKRVLDSLSSKIILLNGNMGVGKTTFVKAFVKVLASEDDVSSPTFSIVNEYEGGNGLVYHFDFYRLKTVQEAYDIGYEDYFYSDSVCLIEWPSKVEELLPETYIKVEINITGETSRNFSFTKIG